MSDLAGTARNTTEQAAQKGEQLYQQAAGEAQRQAVRLADVIKEQPLVAAAVAVAAGYLLGRLIR